MRIDKSGQHNFSRAVDLRDLLPIFLQPGIAQRIFGFSDGNNLAADAKHGAIFDDAEFPEF